jgi:hypothetical protein
VPFEQRRKAREVAGHQPAHRRFERGLGFHGIAAITRRYFARW